MLNKTTLLLCAILFNYVLHAQDSKRTIVAKKGDGILNVLRSNGMNITKYYERFLELNKGNIRNGSELHFGRTYYLPNAPDSFENMGRKIELLSKIDTPIFSDELASIRKKDDSLENTVYYMVLDESKSGIASKVYSKNYEAAKNMAKELISHGAKVYIIENAIDGSNNLGEYTATINRLFLKNNGQYQRLLVMNLNNATLMNNAKITIAHHDNSKKGRKLASNIEEIFQKQNVLKKSSKEYTEIFTDRVNLYLAKNVLPVMTYIEIASNDSLEKNYRSDASAGNSYSDLIIEGIMQDYATVNFDEN